MDAERFERIKHILATLDAMPVPDRAAYLDSACSGDDELRSDVEALMT